MLQFEILGQLFFWLTLEFNQQLQVLEHPGGKLLCPLTLHQIQKQLQSECLAVQLSNNPLQTLPDSRLANIPILGRHLG